MHFSRFVKGVEAFRRFSLRYGQGKRRFFFLGGEPLMAFPLLERSVRHLRQVFPAETSDIFVTTNGTLLTPHVVDRLRELGVKITLSMDGGEAAHDSHRVFASGRVRGSFDLVLRRILQLDPSQRASIRIHSVLTATHLGGLFQFWQRMRQLGFMRFNFIPVLDRGHWCKVAIGRAQRAFSNAARRYIALFEAGEEHKAFVLDPLDDLLHGTFERQGEVVVRQGKMCSCNAVWLDVSGDFYACDPVDALPARQRELYRIGDVSSGISAARRARILKDAGNAVVPYISEVLPKGVPCMLCAFPFYFLSRNDKGKRRVQTSEDLEAYCGIIRVYTDFLRTVRSALQGNRIFSRIYHV